MRGAEGQQLYMNSLMHIFEQAKVGKSSEWTQTGKKNLLPQTSQVIPEIPTENRFSPLN